VWGTAKIGEIGAVQEPLRAKPPAVKARPSISLSAKIPLDLAHPHPIAYPSARMIRFSLFGIPIQIQPFFWITLALISGNLSGDTSEAFMRIGLFVIAGFISVLIHELGHALTGRAFGKQAAITLQAFGGFAAFSGGPFTRPQSFVVTAAGPIAQILLAVLVFLLVPFIPLNSLNAAYFIESLIRISVVWAVLNLLPILPLDGGQLVNATLGPKRLKLTLWITIVAALGTAGYAFYKLEGRAFLLVLFLGMFAYQAFQALRETR